jgi:hypothetical protein
MWFLDKPMKTRFCTKFIWTYEAYRVCDVYSIGVGCDLFKPLAYEEF